MKNVITFVALLALALAGAAPSVAKGSSDATAEDHARELVLAFDKAVLILESHPSPEELESQLRETICSVLNSAMHDGNQWVLEEAQSIDFRSDPAATYESYREFVEAEIKAFKELHPDIAEATERRLRSLLWDYWWFDVDLSNDRINLLHRGFAHVLGESYAEICGNDWSRYGRRILGRRVRGAVYFLGGIAIGVADLTTLVPNPILGGYSIYVGATVAGYGVNDLLASNQPPEESN